MHAKPMEYTTLTAMRRHNQSGSVWIARYMICLLGVRGATLPAHDLVRSMSMATRCRNSRAGWSRSTHAAACGSEPNAPREACRSVGASGNPARAEAHSLLHD